MLIGERVANNKKQQAGFVDTPRVALVGTKLQNISLSREGGDDI